MHLLIDGYGCDAATLQEQKAIHALPDSYPDAIWMVRFAAPKVCRYMEVQRPTDRVTGGIALIAESRISNHTLPERGCVNIDLSFSGSSDSEIAVKAHQGIIGFAPVKSHLLSRGLDDEEAVWQHAIRGPGLPASFSGKS